MKLLDLFLPEKTRFFKSDYSITSENLEAQGKLFSVLALFSLDINNQNQLPQLNLFSSRPADDEPNIDTDSEKEISKSVAEDIQVQDPITDEKKEIMTLSSVSSVPIEERIDRLFNEYCSIIERYETNASQSIEQWVIFHRMLSSLSEQARPDSGNLSVAYRPFAIRLFSSLKLKIEEWYNDKNNSTSPFWYAERAYRNEPDSSKWKNLTDADLKFSLLAIHRISSAIKDILRNQDTDIKAVYYTSLKSLKYIFDKAEDNNQTGFHPQIMSVSVMNDPAEGHLLQEYLSEGSESSHQYWWNTLPSGMEESRYFCIEPYVFCKSFTSEDRLDDLSMWEMYGDHAKGCCCKVMIKNERQEPLYQIAYLDKDKKAVQLGGRRNDSLKLELINALLPELKQLISSVSSFPDIDKTHRVICGFCRKEIMDIAYLFKDDAYSHENEIRYLASFIDSDDYTKKERVSLIPVSDGDSDLGLLSVTSDVAFVYEEVILGPKVKKKENAASYFIHQFICSSGKADSPFITKSSIQYR